MTHNKYDFIASMFTNNDNSRQALLNPGTINDHVYATDAHTCVRFNKKLCSKDYSNNVNFPKSADNIFNELKFTESVVFGIDDFLLNLYHCKLKYLGTLETCEDCCGDGETLCKCCDSEIECKNCEGTGTVETHTTFATPILNGKNVDFLGKTINPKFLYKVAECALILKQDHIEANFNKTDLKIVFKVLDIEILVMTCYISEYKSV